MTTYRCTTINWRIRFRTHDAARRPVRGTVSTYYFLQIFYVVPRYQPCGSENSRGVHEWVLIIVTAHPVLTNPDKSSWWLLQYFLPNMLCFFSFQYLFSVTTCIHTECSFCSIPYNFFPFYSKKTFNLFCVW